MNLEQAIHQHWAAAVDLNALLPAESLVTGTHGGLDVPYATIHRNRNRPRLRTNAGPIDQATVLIHAWHDDYDAGRAIVEKIKTVFDGARFSPTDGDDVLRMRRVDDSADEPEPGLWRFSVEFLVQ